MIVHKSTTGLHPPRQGVRRGISLTVFGDQIESGYGRNVVELTRAEMSIVVQDYREWVARTFPNLQYSTTLPDPGTAFQPPSRK